MDSGDGRFKALLNQTQEIVLVIQSNGRILEINQAAIDAYGYSKDEMLSMNLDELQDPDTVPFIDGSPRPVLETEISYETHHTRKDGSRFPVAVSSRAFGKENAIGYVTVIREISQRVHTVKKPRKVAAELTDIEPTEDTIRTQEEIMERKYNAITAGIVVQDLAGGVIYANTMAEKILDFALDEMKGKTARNSVLKLIDESGREFSLE